eukprot:TRINITY_DN22446_c0_g4_i1.p1 TRINITY_DN22446_c0_g4~~TRINITY_DN22446_c0_g4_i1.p1  ORF type:complete len:546 (+),score=134.45 TRINITY_DN22446_c0_g4_i1:234-1640(+)
MLEVLENHNINVKKETYGKLNSQDKPNYVRITKDLLKTRSFLCVANNINQEIIISLIKKEIQSKYQMNALLVHAASHGYLNIMKYLVGMGADLNIIDTDDECNLCHKAVGTNIHALQYLIDNKISVRAKSKNGSTALHYCIKKSNSTEVIAKLLESNADINAQDNEGKSPLSLAVLNGKIIFVEYLIHARCDLNLQDILGYAPLHHATVARRLDFVELLVNASCNINIQSNDGQTSLWWACTKGEPKIVSLLLNNMADVNLSSYNGDSPIIQSVYCEKIEVVKILINAKADVNKPNKIGYYPVHYAVARNSVTEIEILLDGKADISVQGRKDKNSPLHLAVMCKDSTDMINSLLKNSANVNAQNLDGETPLVLAVANKNKEISKVQALLQAKADVELKSLTGETPLQLAVISGGEEMVNLLLDNKANIFHKNSKDLSVMDYAKFSYNPLIEKLLEERIDKLIEKTINI